MFKRLWKNVILFLCILGLVFQPVISYASDLTYDWSTFGRFVYPLTGSSYYPNRYMTDLDIAAFYDITNHYSTQYTYLSQAAVNIDNAANMVFYKGSDNAYYLYAPDPSAYTMTLGYGSSGTSLYFYNGISNTPTVCRFFKLTNLTQYSTSVSQYPQSQIVTLPLFISTDVTTNTGVNIFVAIESSNYPDISNLSGYSGLPSGIYVGLYNGLFKALANKLNAEYPSQMGSSTDNDKLYYMNYEDGALWGLIQANTGILETYLSHNELYFSNLSGNLASFANNQNTIQEYMSSIIPDVSNIEAGISDINDRLVTAFPDNQAEMNDAIADQILDDTNDTGLTVNRITSAKSDLVEGLSTFKLDTSGSQYSNPFSALDDADWSFWSQTTLNNLGSSYSYSFGGGSLMSEDDIFTENQNTLIDLLGW